MLFPVSPDVFDGIQFGSICRQVLDLNVTLQGVEVIPHETTAMRRQTIPNDQQRTRDVSDQRFQETNHLRALDRAGIEPEVEAPERQAGDGGQRLPIEVVLEDGGLPARRPGPAAVRLLAYSALVDEDDRAALFAGFFLIAGHCLLCHSRIASSLRSRARPVGRWGLQPSETSSFQTCPS